MDWSKWTPGDVIEAVKLTGQLVFGLVVVVQLFTMRKLVDGRMSELIDLAARAMGIAGQRRENHGPPEGTPDRRRSEGTERDRPS